MDKVFLPGSLKGIAAAVPSKSEAHRSLICAGLTKGETVLSGWATSEDMAATMRCLHALGTTFREENGKMHVFGGGPLPEKVPHMDCGESGSTLRFFVPIAMALSGGGVFVMHGHLSRRPMDIYRDLFVPKGAEWHMGIGIDGAAELVVRGRLQPGDYVLPGNVSSQFISGLLLALPLLSEESTLTVTGTVESTGYIDMTLSALKDSGVIVEELAPYSWRIPGAQAYQAKSGVLNGDWSQAAVLLCAGAVAGDITLTGLRTDSNQGDRDVLRMMQKLGAVVEQTDRGLRVKRCDLHGTELDLRNCPDIAPMLALVCQLAEGESRLTGCGRLRLKECDRLAATADILNNLGGCVKIQGDDLVIKGVPQLKGGYADTRFDHRMVMLAAIAALRSETPVSIHGAEALDKSWPTFLDDYAKLGGQAE